jgi:hypothetical protein
MEDRSKIPALILLRKYVSERYHSNSELFFNFFFGIQFGCSRLEKLDAVHALLKVIECGDNINLLSKHQKALNQGRLGKIFNSPQVQQVLLSLENTTPTRKKHDIF